MAQQQSTIHEQPLQSGDESRQALQVRPKFYYYDDLVNFGWIAIWGRITLAGGAYPLVLGAVTAVVSIVASLVSPPFNPEEIVMILTSAPFFALLAGAWGLVWAGVVSLFTLPVIHLVIWSLKQRPSLIWLGAFSGGLVGFLAVLPVAIRIPALFHAGEAWGALIIFLIGPGGATIVGQIGGAIGGRRGAWSEQAKMASRHSLARIGRLRPAAVQEVDVLHEEQASGDRRLRFRVIHLLWVGVWLSLLLTLIRISQIPYEFVLPLIVGWLAYQAATLAAGAWLVRWFRTPVDP